MKNHWLKLFIVASHPFCFASNLLQTIWKSYYRSDEGGRIRKVIRFIVRLINKQCFGWKFTFEDITIYSIMCVGLVEVKLSNSKTETWIFVNSSYKLLLFTPLKNLRGSSPTWMHNHLFVAICKWEFTKPKSSILFIPCHLVAKVLKTYILARVDNKFMVKESKILQSYIEITLPRSALPFQREDKVESKYSFTGHKTEVDPLTVQSHQ